MYKRSTTFSQKWTVRIKKSIKTAGCELIPQHKIIWCAPARFSPRVPLTFDDSPNPAPQLLDALDEFGFNATFFLVGQRAAANRDLIVRIQQSGHQIGDYGYAHESLHSFNFSEVNDAYINRSRIVTYF